MGTVGLTCGLTPTLGVVSQAILIILMFLGRVGIMTFGVGFLLLRQCGGSLSLRPGKNDDRITQLSRRMQPDENPVYPDDRI